MRPLAQNANPLLGFTLLLCLGALVAASSREPAFERSAATLYGKLQLLRQLDRSLLSSAGNADREAFYLQRWREVRGRIDELTAVAGAAASGTREREWLRALSTMTGNADARFEEVRRLRITAAATAP